MKRTEISCPRCGQVNLRYHGRGAWIANPRWPDNCTVCAANLVTGRRGLLEVLRAAMMWAGVYLGHAVVGVGIVTVAASAVWPDLINQTPMVRAAPVAAGAGLGVLLAEWSRRRRTLLGRRRSGTQPPR